MAQRRARSSTGAIGRERGKTPRFAIPAALLLVAGLACSDSQAPPTATPRPFELSPAILATATNAPTSAPSPTTIADPSLATAAQPALYAPTEEAPEGQLATVVRVIDGDTIDVDISGEVVRVRYIGINTPETNETCGDQATAANVALVEGQAVTLVKDVSERDKYARLLRYVYVGNVFVNAELVASGYAQAVIYEPDTLHYDYFRNLEVAARRDGLGCQPTGVFEALSAGEDATAGGGAPDEVVQPTQASTAVEAPTEPLPTPEPPTAVPPSAAPPPTAEPTQPPPTVAPQPTRPQSQGCNPNYAGVCLDQPGDYDCAGGSGNGPNYIAGPFQVVGSDVYDLDRDHDGIACE